MPNNLSLQFSESSGDYQIVGFTGDFDKAGFAEIKDKITDFVLNFNKKVLIFDFTNLKYINSEGIGYLMEAHTHLIQRDRKLIIVGLNEHVKDIFQAIGITEIIPIFSSVDNYLNSIK
ncbi:STAS domain-containing protein [Candidatus Peregrinibacteria bacterium]|nr:STAS domain-containing protein [Candidatus Peregrinibacteria bacterium]